MGIDSKLILGTARGTVDGTLSFPEVVGKLIASGVEYYHVDYVGLAQSALRLMCSIRLPTPIAEGDLTLATKCLTTASGEGEEGCCPGRREAGEGCDQGHAQTSQGSLIQIGGIGWSRSGA